MSTIVFYPIVYISELINQKTGEGKMVIKDRNLYLYGEIGEKSIKEINSEILKLLIQDKEDEEAKKNFKRDPIHLFIDSCGGIVYDCLSLIDLMTFSKTPIYTYCSGYAMSCGFLIFISGTKRFIGNYATLMCHQISGRLDFKITDIEESLTEYKRLENVINSIITTKTKITPTQLKQNREGKTDWYIDASEAINLGCADEIMMGI